jgi:putative thiamine transport system permease protein
VRATLVSGLGSTVLVLGITFLLFSTSYASRYWRFLQRFLAPLLAIPHAAFAIGFLFLVAPSGWILRAVSPWLTGFSSPPDWSLMRDSYGFSLMATLVIKEVPFLVLMAISALSQIDIGQSLAVGRSLGYDTGKVWTKVIMPQLYPKIRLSLFAILAYSLSVVDIAQIVGPTLPPTLAVQVFRWFNDPDLSCRLFGSSGATFILLLVVGSIGLIYLSERLVKKLLIVWLTNGSRRSYFILSKPFGNLLIVVILACSLVSVLVLIVWSFTWNWRFPNFLPEHWSGRFWLNGLNHLALPAWNTFSTGISASLIALVIVIGCLENEIRLLKMGRRTNTEKILWLIYLPLLIPQIAFLFGVQVILVSLGLEGNWFSLVWSHLLFVLPYVFLTLGPIYRAYDQRLTDVAITLSGSQWKALVKVKWPILLRPILFTLAIGFSVSVAQYLPTLFVGAGRYDTITTEAVALAGGSDRRIVAVYAICQLLGPLLFFLAALLVPRFYFRKRKALQLSQ